MPVLEQGDLSRNLGRVQKTVAVSGTVSSRRLFSSLQEENELVEDTHNENRVIAVFYTNE